MVSYRTIRQLNSIALKLKFDVLEMIGINTAGHLGGSFSLAETMAVLYFYRLQLSKNRLNDPNRDRVILSKGHAALIQYAALCEKGFFPRNDLPVFTSPSGEYKIGKMYHYWGSESEG